MKLILDENTNLDKFWLVEDALSLTSNLFFGIGSSYFCGHGCNVCFIKDELKAMKGNTEKLYGNDLARMSKTWKELNTFFSSYTLDEDPYYFKHFHVPEYNWIRDNSAEYSYGTTDNGLFRMVRLPEIMFRDLFELAISMSFVKKVGEDRILDAIKKLKYPIRKMKFLIDVADVEPTKLIEWVKEKNLPIIIHALDFLTGEEHKWNLGQYDISQAVNWVIGRRGMELVKIHINSDCIVYYDRFVFSNNVGDTPYFTMGSDGFDHKAFLPAILRGKQENYQRYKTMIDNELFIKYYETTQNYTVNDNYTFIPNFMVNYKIRYFNRLLELGWTPTKYGLLEPNFKELIPLIEKKNETKT